MTCRDTNKLTHHYLYLTILADYWTTSSTPSVENNQLNFNIDIKIHISNIVVTKCLLLYYFVVVPREYFWLFHCRKKLPYIKILQYQVMFKKKKKKILFQCAVHLTQPLHIWTPV